MGSKKRNNSKVKEMVVTSLDSLLNKAVRSIGRRMSSSRVGLQARTVPVKHGVKLQVKIVSSEEKY